jgi:GDPmannose 4,6-dehydratase
MGSKKSKLAMVTGITGQDGSYLAEFLLEKGYRVIGLKRRSSLINSTRVDGIYGHPRFHMEFHDLNDAGNIWKLINEYKPDEFYNLAAQSHVRVSFDIPEHTVDGIAMGTLRILNALKELVPKCRFYQASSSEMYGDVLEYPQSESTPFSPASPYACAKLFSHNLVNNYREGYDMHASSGILFNHESPRRGETFVTRKITMAAARIKLGLQGKLYLGNLDAKRDWGFAGDYVEAMWLMLQQDKPDDYVIATGETHTVREFLSEVFDHAGLDYKEHVEIDSRFFRPHEVPILLGDAAKAKQCLGWQPKITFKDLAKMMYDSDLNKLKGEIR